MSDGTQAQLPIAHTLDQIDQWHELTQSPPPEVEPGSDLDGDLHTCSAYPVGYLSWIAITAAIDHLSAFSHLIRAGVLHTYAPYTLLRSAIECASQAIWMLAPDDRLQRIERALRTEHEDARQMVEAIEHFPDRDSEANQRRRLRPQKIRDEADRVGVNQHTVAAQLSMRVVVREAGRWTFPNGDLGASTNQFIWQACSGMAHGRRWAAMSLLTVEARTPIGGGVQAQVTGNEELLTYVLLRAEQLTAAALALFEKRRRVSLASS